MADKHPSAENVRHRDVSDANLGQKKAERERISDEKMSHMEKDSSTSSKPNEKKTGRK